MLDIHVRYLTSRIKPTSISLLTYASIKEMSFKQKFRWACLIRRRLFFTARRCTTTFGSKHGISLYVYAKMSMYSFNWATYVSSSSSDESELMKIGRGVSWVARSTSFNSSTVARTPSLNSWGASFASSASIGTSSHKVIWNDDAILPCSLRLHLDFLGVHEEVQVYFFHWTQCTFESVNLLSLQRQRNISHKWRHFYLVVTTIEDAFPLEVVFPHLWRLYMSHIINLNFLHLLLLHAHKCVQWFFCLTFKTSPHEISILVSCLIREGMIQTCLH